MLYNILARAVWDVDTDYKAVIDDVCTHFYGPAAQEMIAYNLMMSEAINQSTAWQQEGWRPNEQLDIALPTLAAGRELLEQAVAKAAGDSVLIRRLAHARFGHACLTYVHAQNLKPKTLASAAAARQAFDEANALRRDYQLMVKLPTVPLLEKFFYPEVTGETFLTLPRTWAFKKDPDNLGQREAWFRQAVDTSWDTVNVDEPWTSQPCGSAYHGAAWYAVSFTLPEKTKQDGSLVLYFGAVDGYCDVYLDGTKIGEQKNNVGMMWDKPFTVILPETLDVHTPHVLMVRVEKDSYAAGIWKPVAITQKVSSNGEAAAAEKAGGRVDW